MRSVFSSGRECAHVWASQSQPSGRAGNVYFTGDTIYSYGGHFPMGRIVTRNGRTAALLTTRDYSNTTAKHKGYARSAVSHMTQFYVPLGEANTPREMFDSYAPRVADAIHAASKARLHRERYFSNALALVDEANNLAEFFGIRSRMKAPADIADAIAEAKRQDALAAKRNAKQLAREAAAREAAAIVARAETAEDVPRWQAGEIDYIRHSGSLPFALLRVRGDEVETTMRARVPLAHAERAYKVLKRLRDRGKTYQRNGHTINVGHYGLDSMDEAGIVSVGCHRFEWQEIERLAVAAGWQKSAAA